MNVHIALVFLATIFQTVFTGRIRHRGCPNDHECWHMFKTIYDVMSEPNFKNIVTAEGLLNLDCSPTMLQSAYNCTAERRASFCPSGYASEELLVGWRHFCTHKISVESEPECWTNPLFTSTTVSCFERFNWSFNTTFINCVAQEIPRINTCSAVSSDVIVQLLTKYYELRQSID